MFIRIIILLCLFTLILPARAGIEQFIDDQTVIAGEADLNKVDPAALETFILELMKNAEAFGPAANRAVEGPGGIAQEQDARTALSDMKRWVTDMKNNGGTTLYLIGTTELLKDGRVAIIAPAPDANAKILASLLFSGTTTGPTGPPTPAEADPAQRPRQRYPQRAEVLPGIGAVLGSGGAIELVKKVQPKDRPDFKAALAASGDAPIKLAILPTDELRAMLQQGGQMQFNTLLSKALSKASWIVATVAAPPQPQVRAIIKANSADSAKELQQITMNWLGLAAASGTGITQEFIKLVTPTVQGDQVIASLDQKQMLAMATELQEPVRNARQRAMRVASMSNMRQILMALQMYRAEQKGEWPDDLKAIEKYVRAPNVFINPLHPDSKPAYIYLKPAAANPGMTAVLYESHTDFGNGVSVGFSDGHVEFVVDKQKFDDLLANQGGI